LVSFAFLAPRVAFLDGRSATWHGKDAICDSQIGL